MSTEAPAAAAGISYVYAVGRAGTGLDTMSGPVPGLDGGVLRTVRAAGLDALVSSVSARTFSTEGMKAQMEDLKRLEEIARTHHLVVEAAYACSTVLPMRLATVYLDDTRVTEMLHQRGADFCGLLARLEDHVELGVKVYADLRQPAEAETADAVSTPAPVSPGRAYLQKRRAQRRSTQDVYRAAGALAAEVPGRVAALARDRVAHRPQQGELATAEGENIANDAYLVPAARAGEFRAALDGLAEDVPGVRIEITGPWAPYSFATPPAEAGGGRSER
ncbi:GvpL/GvpF family gas vesicle protein [Streptomyces sp. NBC_00344]|uniref:GvpL/GvpF family gas vesicle protein n=1 Tax=Streptomyces sp. NBC_00344 TaxID=2975720 RepID=UPI002E1CCE03